MTRLLDTNISDVYDQGAEGDCWIYTSVNMFMRFIIQVFNHYHPNKKYFAGKGKYAEKYINDQLLIN
jgi:C1A family cysteine protease